MPLEFAAADAERAFDADRSDGAFGEANRGVSLADERRGELTDVGGVADPGDGIGLLLTRPFDQFVKVAAGAKGIEFGNLRWLREMSGCYLGCLSAADVRAGGDRLGRYAASGEEFDDLGEALGAFLFQRPLRIV